MILVLTFFSLIGMACAIYKCKAMTPTTKMRVKIMSKESYLVTCVYDDIEHVEFCATLSEALDIAGIFECQGLAPFIRKI